MARWKWCYVQIYPVALAFALEKNDKVQLINMRKWPTGFIIFIEEIY